jgi:hypothetical protein
MSFFAWVGLELIKFLIMIFFEDKQHVRCNIAYQCSNLDTPRET